MILDEGSSSWTATEVDPFITSDLNLIQSAQPIAAVAAEPEQKKRFAGLLKPGSARLVGQVAVVIVAALVVGFVVFTLVSAVAGSDDDGSAAPDSAEDRPVVQPGPGGQETIPANSSRSGSQRSSGDSSSSAALGSSTEQASDEPTGPTLDLSAGDSDEADVNDLQSQVSGPGSSTTDPGQSTSSIPVSATSVTGGGAPSSTTSTPTTPPSSAMTTAKPTTTGDTVPTSAETTVTTRPTTTNTVATTVQTTVTIAATAPVPTVTAPPILPASLIIAPANDSVQSWNTVTKFRANLVPGAATYCWTIVAIERVNDCGAGRAFDLPAAALSPGPATVKAEAFDLEGELIMSGRLDISLLVTKVLDDPDDGKTFDRRDRLRLRAEDVPTADNYCWVLTGNGYSSGEFCDRDGRVSVPPGGEIRRGLGSGPVKVQGRAYRGSTLVGRQTVTIVLE